ncbi:MAG: phosphonate ABC transporter, permease protein PhnE [Rhodospirillales bacterium]
MTDQAPPSSRRSYPEPGFRWLSGSGLRFSLALAAGLLFYASCIWIADVSPQRLIEGLPRLARWSARAWPPDFAEWPVFLRRAAETVGMATVGTTLAALLATPLCLLAARTITPSPALYYPARWCLNVFRGVDSFVFALLFVAAVGLGPFAGVLGIALHSAGSVAKLWAEAIEAMEKGPIEAAQLTGANRVKIVAFVVLPDVTPSLMSILLYLWEFNVRASTVLGIVGAGGIGQELKNSIDLLDFPRLLAILLIILAMVTAIDQLSAWLRRRLT